MAFGELKASIIRLLQDDELSGYSIYKVLARKGMETWPNHVYTQLVEMEKGGWLKSKWVGNKKDARRRHVYSLSESGEKEYEKIIRDSLGILMERFFKENLDFEDLPFHIGISKETYGGRGRLSENEPFRLVVASPTYHPLICFPKFYYALSEAYPKSTVYVVKNPWERPLEGTKNLIFLDGSRDEIPLRDNFADYILLQGFPNSSSVAGTIGECLRVLRDGGCLFVEIPSILTSERRPRHNTVFPEYVLKLFYELNGQDRVVRTEEVSKVLSYHFENVRSLEVRGKVIYYAAAKKARAAVYAKPARA